jgi:DNA polymerase-1
MVAFRVAASAEGEDEPWVACARADSFIDEIIIAAAADEYEVWLSGSNNFRYGVYPEYKANRKGGYRPKWEVETKDYLKRVHNAQTIEEAEADDALGARQTEDTVIVTNDKDLKMIKGLHYDPVKKLLWSITPEEATRWFYYQMLVGDPVDNIKGVSGIGPVKANRILDSCASEEEMFQAVMDNYSSEEEYLMNARCLWIWHKENDEYTLDTRQT